MKNMVKVNHVSAKLAEKINSQAVLYWDVNQRYIKPTVRVSKLTLTHNIRVLKDEITILREVVDEKKIIKYIQQVAAQGKDSRHQRSLNEVILFAQQNYLVGEANTDFHPLEENYHNPKVLNQAIQKAKEDIKKFTLPFERPLVA